MYPECPQLNIINGGLLVPTSSELVNFPGVYSNSDPGVYVDGYSAAAQTQSTYQIPGQPLYSGASGVFSGKGRDGAVPSSTIAVTSTSKPMSTSTTKTTTTFASTSSGSGGGSVARYGQEHVEWCLITII
jgi:cellulase